MERNEILHEMLSQGWVVFGYEKKDGTARLAVGTINYALLSKAGAIPEKPYDEYTAKTWTGTRRYYDLTKCGWRQYYESKILFVGDCCVTSKNAVEIASAVCEERGEKRPVGFDTVSMVITGMDGRTLRAVLSSSKDHTTRIVRAVLTSIHEPLLHSVAFKELVGLQHNPVKYEARYDNSDTMELLLDELSKLRKRIEEDIDEFEQRLRRML